MADCIFCKIVQGEVPAKKVYEDEEILAFHDINPQAPVHILIIPKKHIEKIEDINESDAPLIGKLFVVAKKLAKEFNLEDGYRLVINNGKKAGQAVFHIHLHLLGGRIFSWPPG